MEHPSPANVCPATLVTIVEVGETSGTAVESPGRGMPHVNLDANRFREVVVVSDSGEDEGEDWPAPVRKTVSVFPAVYRSYRSVFLRCLNHLLICAGCGRSM